MTGLEKIVDQILAEANTEAERLIGEAQDEAKKIAEQADAETEKSVQDIRKKSEAQAKNLEERMHSSNDLYLRTQTLAAKQEVISNVIETAYRKVCDMDPESYFGMLEKMIEKYALPQSGEIWFSEADLKNMPDGFPDRIRAAAERAGGSLTLSEKGKEIENGFVLVYGGVEQNCTIRAIFDADRDEMQDTVHAILYGKEA